MTAVEIQNANPKVYAVEEYIGEVCDSSDPDSDERDAFTSHEIFELIRHLNDPGKRFIPLSL